VTGAAAADGGRRRAAGSKRKTRTPSSDVGEKKDVLGAFHSDSDHYPLWGSRKTSRAGGVAPHASKGNQTAKRNRSRGSAGCGLHGGAIQIWQLLLLHLLPLA